MDASPKPFNDLQVISDRGAGRALVIVREHDQYHELSQSLSTNLPADNRVIEISVPEIRDDNWRQLTSDLMSALSSRGLRQASFIAFGAAGVLIQHLCFLDLKFVRTLVLVDVATRPHPSALTKLVDRLEGVLPLGLPLRLRAKGFDGGAFLQRIRCPALILTTSRAGTYLKNQAGILAHGLPTAWRAELAAENENKRLLSLVLEFQDTPAKCPQKKRQAPTLTV